MSGSNLFEKYNNCLLCARSCGVDRAGKKLGYCGMPSDIYIARAALHYWEEPIISGKNGSGTIFFSGCSLRCVYCQNSEISRGISGLSISVERLSEIMLNLQSSGAHNINFVTPTHYAPSIVVATEIARRNGLIIPTVYNTGSYDTFETIKMLNGTIDIYLPDLKYYREETARKFSSASDYCMVSALSIDEMVSQQPKCIINNGLLIKGVVVRILLLPGHLAEAKLALKYLYSKYGDSIYISLMSQYTPPGGMCPPLNRRVTRSEYSELVRYAEKLGVCNAFVQDGSAASESFIPPFDNSGVF